MPDCDYCGSQIDESTEEREQPYLTHLAEEHPDEVTRVDERKLEKKWDGDLSEMRGENYRYRPVTIGAAAAAVVFLLGVGVVAVTGVGEQPTSGGGGEPTEWIYEHGQISVQVSGEEVAPSELERSEYFYVANETGEWRMNVPSDRRYTVGDALAGLGLITEPTPPSRVSPEYIDNRSDVEMKIVVNGKPTSLDDTIEQGDNITFIVEEPA